MIASLDFDGASDDDEKLVHARMAVDLLRGCVANREEVNLHSVEGHLLELAMEKVASLEASGEDDDDEAMDEGGSENGSEEEDENEDEDDDKDVNMRNDEPQERAGDRIMYMGPYLTVIGAGNEEAWDEEDNEDNEDSALLEDEEEQAHEEEAQDYEPAEAPRFIFKRKYTPLRIFARMLYTTYLTQDTPAASQLREEDLLPEMSEEEKAARVQAVQRFSVAVKEMEGEKQ